MYLQIIIETYCEVDGYERLPTGRWNIRDIRGKRLLIEVDSSLLSALEGECDSICAYYIREMRVQYVCVSLEYSASIGVELSKLD